MKFTLSWLKDHLETHASCLAERDTAQAALQEAEARLRFAVGRVYAAQQRWPDAELREFEGGAHELLMETPDLRTRTFTAITDFLVG